MIFVADVIKILEKQLNESNKRNEQLQQQVAYLTELIREMNREMFGKSKEDIQVDGQQSLFEDTAPQVPVQDEATTEVSSYKRKSKGTKADKLANFPVEIVERELTDSERECNNCGTHMIDMGSVEARSELILIPATIE